MLQPIVDIRTPIYFDYRMEIVVNQSGRKETTESGSGSFTTINEVLSTWEVYYINGFDDSTVVVQEAFRFKASYIKSRLLERGDLRQTRLTVVAPVMH